MGRFSPLPAVRGLFPVAALALAGCAVNPATGERQLSFISESREIQMGRESDQQVVAQMGLYGGAEMQAYIQRFGSRLAAVSERPALPWTFRVVDDPVVNAFALPGGFIYITRGIMAHFTSEAQLASVVGHEIGHVTARHSVEQLSRAQLAQVGLVAGMVLAPRQQDLLGAAGAGLGVLFLKFGRDDERQSDELGLRYLLAANYDPRPMPEVFTMLGRVSAAHGGGRTPEWLSTHPNPENREEHIQTAIRALHQDFGGRTVGTASYLARLDGMVYGSDPREGYFEENRFLHPDLAFELTFPAGWRAVNQKQGVVAVNQRQDAAVQLTFAESESADAAARAFFAQQGITGSPRRSAVNSLPSVAGDFRAATQGGEIRGSVTFVSYNGTVYQLLGYASNQAWNGHESAIRSSLASFKRLTDRTALNVQPMRLSIVTIDRPMTLEQFAARFPSSVTLEDLSLINQVERGVAIPAGTKLKRVTQ